MRLKLTAVIIVLSVFFGIRGFCSNYSVEIGSCKKYPSKAYLSSYLENGISKNGNQNPIYVDYIKGVLVGEIWWSIDQNIHNQNYRVNAA